MKLTHLFAAIVLVAGFAACKKKEEKAADPGGASDPKTTEPKTDKPAGGRKIPNGQGLTVDAPAKWEDNGIGGAAGMHLAGDAGNFSVMETSAEEAAKPFATWKSETEEILFQKWISAEEVPDGFKALYSMDKIKMQGEEPVKDGSTFAFHTRRKIGGKVHDCYGSAVAEADAKEAIDLCMKVAKN